MLEAREVEIYPKNDKMYDRNIKSNEQVIT